MVTGSGPVRPKGPNRKDSLGIPSVFTGEIACPQRKRPSRSLSEPLIITVHPPTICETGKARDQTTSQEIIRPIPQRADSLGIPPTFTGEVAFPLRETPTDPKDNKAVEPVLPKKTTRCPKERKSGGSNRSYR